MTQLEIFRATVSHQPHGDYLYYAGFTPDLERRIRQAFRLDGDADLRDHFGMFKKHRVGLKRPADCRRPDFDVYYEGVEIPEGVGVNELGVLRLPGDLYHFTRIVSPLRNAKSLAEIDNYPVPSLDDWSEEGMAQGVQQAHDSGYVASASIGHIYENAWQIRGYEQFLEDMMLRPACCDSILERLMERNKTKACAAARAGADVIETGDDVANQNSLMFSPLTWRRFIKSRWKEVYSAARAIKPDIQIWYHSDGNITDIVDELIGIGVTILNPVQPECMDPQEVKARWGERLTIDGTIGTQSTMPWGDSGEVRRIVRKRIETLGYDGALILSPTHVLEPEVPIDNIAAFFEAAGRG